MQVLPMIGGAYLALFVFSLFVTISDWKRIRASATKKILYMFTFPLFIFSFIPAAFVAIFKKVEDEYKNPDEYSLEALKAHMRLLCYILVRNQNTVESPDGKNAIVDNIVVFIKNSFHTDITLSAMAKEHFISSEHLSRIFKNETGFGFNEYLTLVRLQHAQNLLKHHNEMSISEVAYACGFNDSNYFSDKFKKMYGIAPLRYSKTCK